MEGVIEFAGFQLDLKKQIMTHGDQAVHLSNKSLKLLKLLLESQGAVVSKDHITDGVWDGRVVTDAAIAKLVARLKSTLLEYETTPLVETVRGAGYRFLPAVHQVSAIEPMRKPGWTSWAWLSVVVMSVLFLYGLMRPVEEPVIEVPIADETLANVSLSSHRLLLMPTISDGWVNQGALAHLAELLSSNERILSLAPQKAWFDHQDRDTLVIELTSQLRADHVLLAGVTQEEQQYVIDLTLKDSQGVMAVTEMQSPDVAVLMSMTNQWLLEQLSIPNDLSKQGVEPNLSKVRMANENYFMGLAAGFRHDFATAEDHFAVAIRQDPEFLLAKLRMANVAIETGRYAEALARLELISTDSSANDIHKQMVVALKARCLLFLERSDEALDLLTDELTDPKNSTVAVAKHALNSLTMIHTNRAEYEQALDSIRKELAISEQQLHLPHELGKLQLNLGILSMNAMKVVDAKHHASEAMHTYQVANDVLGQGLSHMVLSVVEFQQARMQVALNHAGQAALLLEPLDHPVLLLQLWQLTAPLLIEAGHHQKADELMDKIAELAERLQKQEPLVVASQLRVYLAFVKKQAGVLQLHMSQLRSAIATNPVEFIEYDQRASMHEALMAAHSGDVETAQSLIVDFKARHQRLPRWAELELRWIDAQLMHRQGFSGDAETALRLLLAELSREQLNFYALNVGEDLLTIQASMGFKGFQQTLGTLKGLGVNHPQLARFEAIWHAHQGNFEEAKLAILTYKHGAADLWNAQDQRLLETYQQRTANQSKPL